MSGYFPEAETIDNKVVLTPTKNLVKFRDWFKAAVDKSKDWRSEAREDYEFIAGKQWLDQDKDALNEKGIPAITINKIKPQINVLSGYQRLNRYDIDFLPRTSDDQDLCDVRKGITKYVMDECGYDTEESQVFLDGAVGGIGWFEVSYQWDYDTMDGEAKIVRESPFNMYVDPEARKNDFSDAKFICRAKWADKEELCLVYPEHEEEIKEQSRMYDTDEQEYSSAEPLWYQRETKKIRIVEMWYKQKTRESYLFMSDGTRILKSEFKMEMLLNGLTVVKEMSIPIDKVKLCVFFDNVELEHVDSPYEHGEFPFVPFCVYNFGEGDIPAGVVRDLKDPQREINKRRSQALHILNTQSNSGWMYEEDAMSPDQEVHLKNRGSIPGVTIKVQPNALSSGKIRELNPGNPPAALLQSAAQSEEDIPAISGINEALMGTDIPNSASGRAIELKQKQAITHISPMFDSLRKAKKKIVYLLWGKRGRKGIIPQYYTESKCYRIVGKNGKPEFINVNQPTMINDPIQGVIQTTLNDLSQGEFDIVIADTPATATQRISQFWSLVDAVQKLGIPGDMVFDILIDLSDIPDKEDIKQRWQQRQQAQQEAQAQQVQNQAKISESIAFKDAPLFIQFCMAAKAGLIPQQLADIVTQQAMQQMGLPQMQGQMQQIPQGQPIEQQQTQQSPPMTKAALQSMIAGQAPAI